MYNNVHNDLTHLMCPICHETYSKQMHDPINIRCGHDLCRNCLQDMYNKIGVTFPCPLCRREHDGTPPSRMFTNFTLLDNADRSRASSIISCENDSNQLNGYPSSSYTGNRLVSLPVNIPVGRGYLSNFIQSNSMPLSPFPVLALSSSPRGLYRTPSSCQCFQESSYSSSQAFPRNLQGISVDLLGTLGNESTSIPSAPSMDIVNLAIGIEHGNTQGRPTSVIGASAKDEISQHETYSQTSSMEHRGILDYRTTHTLSAPSMDIEHDNDLEYMTSFTEDSAIGDIIQQDSNTTTSKNHDTKGRPLRKGPKKNKPNGFVDTICWLLSNILD